MKKKTKRILLVLGALLGGIAVLVLGLNLAFFLKTPSSYLIEPSAGFAYQPHYECAGFSAAYVLRSLGADAEGMELYSKIPDKNENGTVPPEALVRYLESQGYKAKLCHGTLLQLKYTVSKGTPVIAFVRVSPTADEYHYLPIVGYDKEQVFAAESLEWMVNADHPAYNRSISTADFETMWNTPVCDKNTYITIEKAS